MPFRSAIAEVREAKRQDIHQESDPDSPAGGLSQEIHQALDWTALERLCDRIDVAYDRGEIDQLVAEKMAQIVAQEAQRLPEKAHDPRLSDLFRESPIRRVRSRVLGETVLWAADNAEIPADNDRAVYRASELQEWVGIEPEQLRLVHAVKKALDGEIVAPAEKEEEIWADDVIEPAPYGPGGICWACRQQGWRQKKSGQWICGVCHPEPKKQTAQGGPK